MLASSAAARAFKNLLILWAVVSSCFHLLRKGDFRGGGSSKHPRAHTIQDEHLDRFLKKDRTRFSTLFNIVLLCVLSIFRIVPVTAPRQAQKILLETLFDRAPVPCLHVETHCLRVPRDWWRRTVFRHLSFVD